MKSNKAATSGGTPMTDTDDPPVFAALDALLDQIERALTEIRRIADQMKDQAPDE